MFNQKDIGEQNEKVDGWADDTNNKLVQEINSLGIKHYPYSPNKQALIKALKNKVEKRFGLASVISYKMPRSAIFVHKGVSRGHGINNPRQEKPWFTPVIDANIEELAAIVADGNGTMIINALKIK